MDISESKQKVKNMIDTKIEQMKRTYLRPSDLGEWYVQEPNAIDQHFFLCLGEKGNPAKMYWAIPLGIDITSALMTLDAIDALNVNLPTLMSEESRSLFL